jgi:site-specific recombinase XerD
MYVIIATTGGITPAHGVRLSEKIHGRSATSRKTRLARVWVSRRPADMLRHACGYKLANDGHDTRAIQAYLGHRNIQNTTRYTALAPQRFKEFFQD